MTKRIICLSSLRKSRIAAVGNKKQQEGKELKEPKLGQSEFQLS